MNILKKTSLSILLSLTITVCFGQLNVDCDQYYTLTETSYTGDVSISVSDTMVSAASHTNNTDVMYTAGISILMIDGFEILVGTTLIAQIEDCELVNDCIINGMHAAFAEFDTESYSIIVSGSDIQLTTDGLPNHTSPYWSNTTERCLNGPMGEMCTNSTATSDHPLFVAPTATTFNNMAPGNIDDFNGSYSLTVPSSPTMATPSSTGLGAIGFAVSGSVIYNDEEGPNVPLDNAVVSLDYNGAHTGPQSYHYHLEPVAWSDDDNNLIGIIADGFFLYGRKCVDGTYPDDLDDSGGHTSMTQHSCSEEYHYHIQNELFLSAYYILFPGDYQGSPNSIM